MEFEIYTKAFGNDHVVVMCRNYTHVLMVLPALVPAYGENLYVRGLTNYAYESLGGKLPRRAEHLLGRETHA